MSDSTTPITVMPSADVPARDVEPSIRFVTAAAVWHAPRRLCEELFAGRGPNFFALEDEPTAHLIKSGLGRSIWRVRWGRRQLICKVYDGDGGLSGILRRLIGIRAEREFAIGQAARRRCVSVPEPIAWGRQIEPPFRSVLQLEELTEAVPLSEIGQESWSGSALVDALAALFARSHDAGFVHSDGHAGNILVRKEPSRDWSVWFVDLHSMAQSGRARSASDSAKALGAPVHYLRRVVSEEQLGRFVERYVIERRHRKPSEDVAAFTSSVLKAADVNAVRLAWQRDRRLRRSNKYFIRLDLPGGWSGCMVGRLARRRIDPAPHVVDRSADEWRAILAELLHDSSGHSPESSELEEVRPSNNVRVATCPVTNLRHRVRYALFGSPARRAFEHVHRLRHRDLPAPIILGYFERRQGPFVVAYAVVLPNDAEST